MDEELKKAILRTLTKEDIIELFDVEVNQPVNKSEIEIPDLTVKKYYKSREIPGSKTSCASCGQSMVNSLEHAIELLGGEKN